MPAAIYTCQRSSTDDKKGIKGRVHHSLSITSKDATADDDNLDRTDSLHDGQLVDEARVRASISAEPHPDQPGSLFEAIRRASTFVGDGVCESRKELRLLGILPEVESDDEPLSPSEVCKPLTLTAMLPDAHDRPKQVGSKLPPSPENQVTELEFVGEWPSPEPPVSPVILTTMLPDPQYRPAEIWCKVPPAPCSLVYEIEYVGEWPRATIVAERNDSSYDDEDDGYVSPTDTTSTATRRKSTAPVTPTAGETQRDFDAESQEESRIRSSLASFTFSQTRSASQSSASEPSSSASSTQ